jgi:hypothetical protein
MLKFLDLLRGEYQSGQLGQTVNLLSYDFLGSNPSSPTLLSTLTMVGAESGKISDFKSQISDSAERSLSLHSLLKKD